MSFFPLTSSLSFSLFLSSFLSILLFFCSYLFFSLLLFSFFSISLPFIHFLFTSFPHTFSNPSFLFPLSFLYIILSFTHLLFPPSSFLFIYFLLNYLTITLNFPCSPSPPIPSSSFQLSIIPSASGFSLPIPVFLFLSLLHSFFRFSIFSFITQFYFFNPLHSSFHSSFPHSLLYFLIFYLILQPQSPSFHLLPVPLIFS